MESVTTARKETAPAVTKPVTVRSLRHVLEFGLDGTGARPVPAAVRYERRDGQRRRHGRGAATSH